MNGPRYPVAGQTLDPPLIKSGRTKGDVFPSLKKLVLSMAKEGADGDFHVKKSAWNGSAHGSISFDTPSVDSGP